jgi:DNA-binding NarL/FixJ family response regulator
MPGVSGLDLCQKVKSDYPGIGVIGLSTFNEQGFIEQMMANGASGYVLKNANRQELLEAIHEVSMGRTYLSSEASEMIRKRHELPLVTRREKEVLELLAEGLTNQEIAQRLYLSVNTVDSHRKSLLAKMQARNTAELIRLAFQNRIIRLP